MNAAPHEGMLEQSSSTTDTTTGTRGSFIGHRAVSRVVTLVLAMGFAVVGIAGAASAHHNTISGTVAYASGGGWAVTWRVVNSEPITETITASNRSVVPVGTTLTAHQTRTFTETVTTKPASPLTLQLSAKWSNNATATNYRSIPVAWFEDNCNVQTVTPPTVPVVDDCGPGNAHFGEVPEGPWTSTANSDGSITITANPGYTFGNGQTSVTYQAPTDSNEPCPPETVTPPTVPVVDDCGPGNAHFGQVPSGPWTSVVNSDGSITITANPGYTFGNGQSSVTYQAPTDSNQPCPVVTPPVVTPPVVTPPVVVAPVVVAPEVLPVEIRVVKAEARQIDKCGRASDLFKVAKRSGVVYKADGKVLRQGVWLRATTHSVTVRAQAADATVRLQGKQVWKMTFTHKPCAQAPEISPNTGS